MNKRDLKVGVKLRVVSDRWDAPLGTLAEVEEVGYVGTRAVNQMGFININAGPPGTGTNGRPLFIKFGLQADINSIQPYGTTTYDSLQALVTRQLATPGWSARLSRLEALLPTDQLRTDFNRFLLALAPRVLAANELQEPHEIHWALEDAWALPLVHKRWVRFAMQLTPEQAENLVERAAAKKLCPVHVQRHDDATDGWALATGGYAA